MMKRLLSIIIIPVFVFILSLCVNSTRSFSTEGFSADLNDINKRGSLTIATSNNRSDYFLYKGEPVGFQLEMLEELGSYLGLKIEVIVCNNPGDNINFLKTGRCDMVASSTNLAIKGKEFAEISIPLLKTDLVLVQRKNSVTPNSFIRNIKELEGKSLYLPVMSMRNEILEQFSNQKIVQVIEMPQYSPEKLIESVALGNVDYTVCTNIQADALRDFYPNLDFSTVIKNAEPIVWTFRSSSPDLANKVSNWLQSFQNSTRFAILLEKYFNPQNKFSVNSNRYYAYRENQISIYDDLIKKYSTQINWDWRLLASLIYQESRFHPTIRSHRGAFGLMQMMPSTLEHFGIDTTATPEQQIRAGVRYIKFLDNILTRWIADPDERINFILASYNIGPGHIFDALKLAKKHGKNPQKWFNNVDSCLLMKSEPESYNDPEVQFGYCKGLETFSFVSEVQKRFKHYKNVIKEN